MAYCVSTHNVFILILVLQKLNIHVSAPCKRYIRSIFDMICLDTSSSIVPNTKVFSDIRLISKMSPRYFEART